MIPPRISDPKKPPNRNGSRDSRSLSVGTVKEEYIVGRVLFRFFPFDRFGTVSDTGRLNIVTAD